MINKNIIFFGYDAIGDYISYNSMIRYLSNNYKIVNIVTTHHVNDINYLFNDLDNIIPITFSDYHHIMMYQNNYDIIDVRVGEKYYKNKNCNGNFYDKDNKIGSIEDQYVNDNASNFYYKLGLPVSMRIDNFFFNRNYKKEEELFKILNIEKGKYSVICEYNDCLIKKEYISDDKIINLHRLSNNIFDLLSVIENAKEIHLVENSIALLVYHLQHKKLISDFVVNLHTYSRKENHRLCSGINCNNFYLNMLLYPKLEKWNFIYE